MPARLIAITSSAVDDHGTDVGGVNNIWNAMASVSLGSTPMLLTAVLVRLGVLAMVAFLFTYYCAIVGHAPWTTSVSVWYARTLMLAIAAILAVAIYGFRTTLAGRPLWRD